MASTGDFELDVYTGTENPSKVPGASVRVVDFLRASNKVELFTKILMNKRLVEKTIESECSFTFLGSPIQSYP
ncbi:MAG: hypothetical protein QXW39_09405 [Candidatus Bathyarchaeia archaeon]|uniref:hypothetical protein n=1 Tax=Desulfurococcus sp. TaxID=51678 RepID=UPI0031651D07